MIKVIVFDMDGTLINSDELVLSIYKKLISKYQTIICFEDLIQDEVLSLSYPEVLKKLYGESNDLYMQEILSLHQELKHQYLKIFHGIDELLLKLKREGYKLGILTSEIRKIAIDELKIVNLFDYFDHIVCFDDLTHPKPFPDGLINHMQYFDCTHEEMIYVGDQKSDGQTAKQAFVYSILVDWTQTKKHDIMNQFDHTVNHIEDLYHVITLKNKHIITMKQNDSLKILQLTDFHLMNDEKDVQTYTLIHDMIHHTKPDFIVLTGDQTVSKDAPLLYNKLGKFMDQYKIPYTFVFGNHDVEGTETYQDLIDSIISSNELWFEQGPKHLGFSNHQILIQNEDHHIIASLVMLDTHIDDFYTINGQRIWGYGSISLDQIQWYQRCINRHPYPHLIFFHIPISEVKEANPSDSIHQGDYYENASTPPINTGFFHAAKSNGLAKAMFFGHDHLNDFTYDKDGIILAYGRVSGHYDYAMPGFPKGARLIKFSSKGEISTEIILHKDIKRKEDKTNGS